MSNLSNSLTVPHLTWAIWAICLQSLICPERWEQITLRRSFDLSYLSKWAMSKWANSQPCKRATVSDSLTLLFWKDVQFAQKNKRITLVLFGSQKTRDLLEKPISKIVLVLTLMSRSLISQLNIPGVSRLYSSILFSTSGVATRGLLPPITPGRMLPVSWYLAEFSVIRS